MESEPSALSDPLLPPQSPPSAAGDDYPPPISFVPSSSRRLRDLPVLLLFLLLSLSTFALGIFSLLHHNPDHSCSQTLTLANSSSRFRKELIWTLVATAALAAPIALGLLSLLRRFAKQIIYASLPFFVLIPCFLNLYWFVACELSDSCSDRFPLPYRILALAFVFVIIAIFIWIIIANWHRVELTVKIVGVSAAALEENIALMVVLPAMWVGVLVYFAPVVVFLVFARWNGRVLMKDKGSGVYECVWKQDGWVPAYFALAIITMIWTAAAMVEAQVYVISGTVAQWYFEKEGKKRSRSIRSSMR